MRGSAGKQSCPKQGFGREFPGWPRNLPERTRDDTGSVTAMAKDHDAKFHARADAHIHLSNDQLAQESRGKVSASMMYATARFNAWVSAKNHGSGEDLAAGRRQTIDYFVDSYRAMLEENLDDYIRNFEAYMKRSVN
jgi:hypothetical protein